MKIVINKCFGGFSISEKAVEMLSKLKGKKVHEYLYESEEYATVERNDADLIKIVEELKGESYGDYAELSVVEIPDDVEWEIEEYDGKEWIAEKHRTWS